MVPGPTIKVFHKKGVFMISSIALRLARLMCVALAALLLVFAVPQADAQDKVLRVGTLKLIHGISAYFYEKFAPPGYTVEVIPFESPTDGKNAVLTGTVDTCIHGIAAFILVAGAFSRGTPQWWPLFSLIVYAALLGLYGSFDRRLADHLFKDTTGLTVSGPLVIDLFGLLQVTDIRG